jgi:hypothetical protein
MIIIGIAMLAVGICFVPDCIECEPTKLSIVIDSLGVVPLLPNGNPAAGSAPRPMQGFALGKARVCYPT